MKRILIIAGEASADIHAANLVRAVSDISKDEIEFTGLGGDSLISTGRFTPEFYNRDFAVSGLFELAQYLPRIYSALKHFKEMANFGSYDLAVLLDYPDFNIPLARHLTKIGVPVIYYISPQVWAWRASRAYKLSRWSREILTVFPFEKDFYKGRGIDVRYVGHPIIDQIDPYLKDRNTGALKKEFNIKPTEKIIAVLPGSRHGEIKYILPILENTCRKLKEKFGDKVRFILPLASTLKLDDITSVLKGENRDLFEIVQGRSYDIYSVSNYAIVASGTSTVECGLFGLPMTIVYKVSSLSAFLFKKVIRYTQPIGMVNLLLGEKVAEEFFQGDALPELIADDVLLNLNNTERYKEIKTKLKKLRSHLYTGESATRVAAKYVLKYL